ncbi:MAG: hypothetical protein GY816_01755 [Cytophagales bacterium]|nr:hypothetical protein [Cytophagales bacterium]
MNLAERKCLDCNKEIEGRIDKKFCSEYCKSAYHYKKNQVKEKSLYSEIDWQLKLNRRILKNFNRAGKATVRKQVLLTTGFNPKYFTHYWKNGKGQVYLFCYEYGFLALKEGQKDNYVLVQWQPYMDK